MRDIADRDGQLGKFGCYPVNINFKRTKKILLLDVICNRANDFWIVLQDFSRFFNGVASLLNLPLVAGSKRSTDVR